MLSTLRTESIVDGARRSRSDWGDTDSVAIAARDLEPGAVIGVDDVEVVDRPRAVLVDGIATTPTGRTVTASIARGEAILDRRLSGGGSGPGAMLGPDHVGFAVPVDQSTPSLRPGDHVDVFAPVDSTSRVAVGATRVCQRAVVVSVSDRSVMVGVDPASAAAVARALLGATVILALAD